MLGRFRLFQFEENIDGFFKGGSIGYIIYNHVGVNYTGFPYSFISLNNTQPHDVSIHLINLRNYPHPRLECSETPMKMRRGD